MTSVRGRGGRGVVGIAAYRMRVIQAYFVVHLRDQMAYLGEVALGGIILAVLLFVLTQLWQATFRFQGAHTLGGYTLAQVIWYLVLTEAFITSRVAFARKIDTDVRTGDLAYALVRPGGYVSAHFGAYLAERLVRFAFALLVGGVFALLSVGAIPVGPVPLLVGLTASLVAMLLDFVMVLGIGLGEFWIEDTSSIYLIYTRVSMILGGLLIPIDLFPDTIGAIARALPFAAMIHGPARLVLSSGLAEVPGLFTMLGGSLALAGGLVWWEYGVARRRVTAQGG